MCEDKNDGAKCAIETVKKLLERKEESGEFKYGPLVEYDFKNEVIGYYEEHVEKDGKKEEEKDGVKKQNNKIRKELYDEKVGLKKYILYKKMGLNFDCDNSKGSCPLTGNIYKVLWGKGKYRQSYNKHTNFDSIIGWESTEEQPMLFGGDVMNSFATTLEKTIEGQNILGLLNESNEDGTYSINNKIKKKYGKKILWMLN